MSQDLDPLLFPLHGARLIEASAGTGKTWTIAALYLRLVLGHGDEAAFCRALSPQEILVMTFTKAATKELTDRIRARLVLAAGFFRGEPLEQDDPFLTDLASAYPGQAERQLAAHRLMLAAEAMDDAAIFTIDAWCQRMLREHAFDSGCLFDEELISSETVLLREATRDYWRAEVYPLDAADFGRVAACWSSLPQLESQARELVARAHLFQLNPDEALGSMIARLLHEQAGECARLKAGWHARANAMQDWLLDNKACFNGTKLRSDVITSRLDALRAWAAGEELLPPAKVLANWLEFADKANAARKDPGLALPSEFEQLAELARRLAALDTLPEHIRRHGARGIAERAQALKQSRRQFGFADMLARLKQALEGDNGPVLRRRIIEQFPLALVDEFQDTSPDQYAILDRLYEVDKNSAQLGLFLIGDPKQAIYGFRGADIQSYLKARQATEGRHYRLGTNYRSTRDFIEAVNHVFLHAEQKADTGAFRFRRAGLDPVPFEPVGAKGRKETLVCDSATLPALTLWCNDDSAPPEDYFAHACAERIVTLLNDEAAGFLEGEAFRRLRPDDMAVLVRNRIEAAAVRSALSLRGVRSVYLSDKDSVFRSAEAADVLRWLRAIESPLDGRLGRAAFATRTAGLALAELVRLASDDAAWEARVEQLKALRAIWQKQGVLTMLRRFMQELSLPARLLPEGERALTNLLHLSELLQAAAQQVDGEAALVQWFAAQVEGEGDDADEQVLRLESDAGLVKVVTVHKSKGLEYPLVFLPYAVSARVLTRRNSKFFDYIDANGERQIDFARTDAGMQAANAARLDEDVRLLYVALTRARHALWMGVAAPEDRDFAATALGYLVGAGEAVAAGTLLPALQSMCSACASICIEHTTAAASCTRLQESAADTNAIRAPRQYTGEFERRWSIASYTSITRDMGSAPTLVNAQEEKLLDQDDLAPVAATHEEASQAAPWHRFPRGSLPGQFMHAQLEWLANAGFASVGRQDFAQQVAARCERAGWRKRREDVATWLTAIAQAVLPPLGQSLSQLARTWPEMEFWVPASGMQTASLDRLCQTQLLGGRARAPLQERQLRGMLRGFKDLVFEHGGRYWVLDYKSNSLGSGDAAYHPEALADAIAGHRYDVQGVIYLLALHRLLKSRLGPDYDPQEQLGGAIFYFLRGVGNEQTRGCYLLQADTALLNAADALLPQTLQSEQAA